MSTHERKRSAIGRVDEADGLFGDQRYVAEAIAVTRPFAVDVASGVEAEPGRKDHAAMAAFFDAAKATGVPAP